MKFNCSYNLFHTQLSQEFGLENFLDSLQIKSTFLANYKLDILSKNQALDRYDKITKCLQTYSKPQLQKIIDYFNQIPNIDYIKSDVLDSSLDQIQCKQLAEFCILNHKISQVEQTPIKPSVTFNDQDILKILQELMQDEFLAFNESETLIKIKSALQVCNQNYDAEVSLFESKIFEETGLKLYYPYKKEVNFSDKLQESISNCPHLVSEVNDRLIIVDYKPSDTLLEILQKRETHLEIYNLEISKLQSQINSLLQPHLKNFCKYLETRKQDLLIYSLSYSAYKYHLCIPKLSDKNIHFKGARLFSLEQSNVNYKPLTIESKTGASILFGANMTGKTTVLKTLYFQFCLIQLGLPLPAISVECFYPSEVLLKLKNSGSLSKGLSSFGEEIEFWTQKFKENSVILCDELFLNTEPSAGEIISKIFIDYVKSQELFFMCSSHYTNLFDVRDVDLFYMKSTKSNHSLDRHNLLEQIPFELAPLKKDDKLSLDNMKKEAIEMALCFDIPRYIKDQLKDYLKGQ